MIKTIKLNGECSDDAVIQVYIDGQLKQCGYGLGEYTVDDFNDHYLHVDVTALKGWVSVATIETNFCQDINPALSLEDRQAVYKARVERSCVYVKEPYAFRPVNNVDTDNLIKDLLVDERINLRLNYEPIDITMPPDDDYLSYAGWHYRLEQGDTLSFDVELFYPEDMLGFVLEQRPGKEFFDAFIPPTV